MQLQIANIGIRQDVEGRYCLNDLHRAAGNEKRHQPSNWLVNNQTTDLIKELSITGITGIESKQGLGTFVCKELVYSYAMWISPAFHLKVIRTFDAVATGQLTNPAQMSRMQLLQLAMQAEEERLALEHKVEVLAPQAAVAERITKSDGLLGFREVAKILNINERKFKQWLIGSGWIHLSSKRIKGLADKCRAGYVEHKTETIDQNGEEKTVCTMFFTPKGLTKLTGIFNDEPEIDFTFAS